MLIFVLIFRWLFVYSVLGHRRYIFLFGPLAIRPISHVVLLMPSSFKWCVASLKNQFWSPQPHLLSCGRSADWFAFSFAKICLFYFFFFFFLISFLVLSSPQVKATALSHRSHSPRCVTAFFLSFRQINHIAHFANERKSERKKWFEYIFLVGVKSECACVFVYRQLCECERWRCYYCCAVVTAVFLTCQHIITWSGQCNGIIKCCVQRQRRRRRRRRRRHSRHNNNNNNIDNKRLWQRQQRRNKCVFAQIVSVLSMPMVMCTFQTTIPHFFWYNPMRNLFRLWTFLVCLLHFRIALFRKWEKRITHSLTRLLTFMHISDLYVSLLSQRYSHSECWPHRCTHSQIKHFAKTKFTFLIDVWERQELQRHHQQQQLVLEYPSVFFLFLINCK